MYDHIYICMYDHIYVYIYNHIVIYIYVWENIFKPYHVNIDKATRSFIAHGFHQYGRQKNL